MTSKESANPEDISVNARIFIPRTSVENVPDLQRKLREIAKEYPNAMIDVSLSIPRSARGYE